MKKVDNSWWLVIVVSIIVLLIYFCVPQRAHAFNPADWLNIPNDKVLHFEGSYLICDYMQDEMHMDNIQTFVGISAISLTKEYLDEKTGGKWDNTDILANLCGWAFRRVFVVKLKF